MKNCSHSFLYIQPLTPVVSLPWSICEALPPIIRPPCTCTWRAISVTRSFSCEISTQSLPGNLTHIHRNTQFPPHLARSTRRTAHVCLSVGLHVHRALTNEPSSVKWLVIRTHWLLIASRYHLKVSGGWNQRLGWMACVRVCGWHSTPGSQWYDHTIEKFSWIFYVLFTWRSEPQK